MSSYFPNALAEFVYYRTYSRFRYDLGRREHWPETVERTINYFREIGENRLSEETYQELHDALLHLRVVPSMRLVTMAGEAARRQNIATYNCSALGISCIDAFGEVLYLLSQGTGVGFSVESWAIDQLPVAHRTSDSNISHHIVVEDSAEGWADAFKEVIRYAYDGVRSVLDVRNIRPAGSILRVKGGRASGPEPLQDLCEFTQNIIIQAGEENRKLKALEVHDICTKIGTVIVSGGVRRSAMISLSNLHDEDMQFAKSGAFWEYTPWRAMANNSAVYINKPSWKVFQKEWNSLAESGTGERGIFNRYGANSRKPERREAYENFITNPCFSAGTMILTRGGHFPIEELVGKTVDIWNGSGWQTVDNFRITGENQPMLKITLDSGITERVTPYHTMILQDGTRLAAKDLVPGDKLLVSNAPLILGDTCVPGAYLNGVVQSVNEDGIDDKVYCCTVSGVHALALSCGFMFGQCGEVVLRDAGLCNLCEIIVRSDDSLSSLLEKARIAAIFGTLQSSLTHFPYLRPIWKKNSEEERLLGVSLTGQMDNSHLQQHPEWFQQIKEVVIDTNKQFSKRLGINQSVATTCVKPSGTVSLVVNSSSGVHARWSPYYIRRVRISSYDTLCKLMMAAGAPMVPETGQTKENATTWVIEFPVKSPEGSVYRYDKTAIEQAEYVMMLQKHYAEHSVSATIYVGNDEWDNLGKFIYENFDYVNGMSFLPRDDAIYPLAPYEDIDEDTYNKLVAEFPEIPYDLLYTLEAEDYTEGSQTLACVAGACEVV